MRIIAPVTDYIPASLLTTLNDIVVRGAAAPERQPGLLRAIGIHIGNNVRNAGGAQIIGGVGFPSSAIIVLAVDATALNPNWSVGFSDGTDHRCIFLRLNGTSIGSGNANIAWIERPAGVFLTGVISAIGADGFTITWTIAGGINIQFVYLCLP